MIWYANKHGLYLEFSGDHTVIGAVRIFCKEIAVISVNSSMSYLFVKKILTKYMHLCMYIYVCICMCTHNAFQNYIMGKYSEYFKIPGMSDSGTVNKHLQEFSQVSKLENFKHNSKNLPLSYLDVTGTHTSSSLLSHEPSKPQSTPFPLDFSKLTTE